MDYNKIGSFIKELRDSKKWSQQKLADMIPIDRSNISRWEKGEVIPTLDKIQRLCEIFDINIIEFISGEGETQSNKQKNNKKIIDILTKEKNKFNLFKIIAASSITLLFIVMFLFLLYYFKQTYNTERIYKVYIESDNYEILDGVLFITREESYLKIGCINNESKNIKLYLTDENTKKLIYEGYSDALITDYSGYNSKFDLKNFESYKNNIYILIDNEELKLNFIEQYKNENLILEDKAKINKEKYNLSEDIPIKIKTDFKCLEDTCSLEKNNISYSYNILSKQFAIMDGDIFILYYINSDTFNYTSPDMTYSVTKGVYNCSSTNCSNYEESYKKYYSGIIEKYIN